MIRPYPKRRLSLLVVAILSTAAVALPAPGTAQGDAVPTRLVVRAVADDAKIIGSGVGGARITIRDVETGRILASGVQEGSTGSTDLIMRTPRERGATVFDTEGAAHFTAELALERPITVEVVAEGPLGTPHAIQRASRTLLLVPGHHVDGEGVVLVLSGFTVELLEPASGEALSAGAEIPVRARVTMICGCPTEPGGLWDADRIEIGARVLRDGRILTRAPLSFAGETSVYEGLVRLPAGPGPLELQVIAVDTRTPNAGIVRRRIALSR